jgi:flagellar biosynthesis protein FlhG
VSRVGEGRAIRGQLQLVVDRFVTPMLPAGETAPKLELIGEVPLDGAVREAVQKRQLLLEVLPGAPAARAIEIVATRLAP